MRIDLGWNPKINLWFFVDSVHCFALELFEVIEEFLNGTSMWEEHIFYVGWLVNLVSVTSYIASSGSTFTPNFRRRWGLALVINSRVRRTRVRPAAPSATLTSR